jgi:tRNA threonylcarbamoyladenosine biosynthesis protein TsaB
VNLLGIDTSTAATAVCVLRSDGEAFESVPSVADLSARPSHARELMPRVHGAMGQAGLRFDELGVVAVGVGPGAYTGLRIGIATARAIAQAHELEVSPVDSLAALATGIGTPIALPVIDARRGEVFVALYVDGRERLAPVTHRPEDVGAVVRESLPDGAGSPVAAGDGSIRFRHVLEAAGIAVAPPESRRHVIRALEVCRLAAAAPAVAPEAVVPRYLRAPDATPR